MAQSTRQIFQTSNPARWRSFKWSIRIAGMIVLFFTVTVALAVMLGRKPDLPNIEAKAKAYENAMNPSKLLTFNSKQNKKLKGFKDFLEQKDSIEKGTAQPVENNSLIRAAFYTPWFANSPSYKSLVKYGRNLNIIFPEWFFITPKGTIDSRIDKSGLTIMKQYGLKIVPMLTNFNSYLQKPDFDGKLINELLINKTKQKQFIEQLADTLTSKGFAGINIDFEEINQPANEYLTEFFKNLYAVFHPKGLLVTADVSVDNTDYDIASIEANTDYMVLMAYDEYNESTGAGPICSQKWIEAALDKMAKEIDSKKIILGVAAYGRDWIQQPDGKSAVADITYAEVINNAKLSNATIDFNNDNYNLSFAYGQKEQSDEPYNHTVWFTDAATTFNILRFSDEYGTAGTAMWRLGSEDQRIWNFYGRSLTNKALENHSFNFNTFQYLPFDINQKPTAIGEGELLNVLYSPQQGKATVEVDSSEKLITEQIYNQLPSGYIYEKFAEDTTIGKGHKIVLTFDDGPGAEYTPQVLNILEKENVPATFFIVGVNAESNIPLLQRIYKDGYEIGNHTFTHSNIATMSAERASIEMKTTRLLIESITGRSTILFRAPFNADSQPQTYEEIEPVARSKNQNYITVGESIDPNDWDDKHTNADSIVNRTIRQFEEGNANIILLHDAGGESRQATVDALPRIIEYFRNKGCKFTTVADLMGKTKDDVMPPVQQQDRWIDRMNFFFAEAVYWGGKLVFALFIVGIVLSIGRMIAMAMMAALQRRKEKNEAAVAAPVLFTASTAPLVSIIVPAYNEEVNAVRTVSSLLKQDYLNLQIIFVDDGSKDETFARVNKAFEQEQRVKVYTKPNGGKASALNFGIEHTDGNFLVCIDADTQLKTDAVTELMKKFNNDIHVGAVAGNVKVGNEINMLTRWQSIEYITSQNFDRRAFDLLNCITVVPGAIGAFRKEAVQWAGGFTTDTLAEDADLTMRLLRKGYTIRNCTTALSYTEAPETLHQFLKQRFRWSYGIIQSFWKHRDAVFNPKFKSFGMIALPNILIFQILLTILAPLADFILILSLLAAGLGIIVASVPHILLYYFLFTLVDVGGAALAFAFEKEDYKKLFWLIPQRLVYRQLMYYILFKSLLRAVKGEAQGWGVLKRTGNVNTATGV
ncbi:MAG: glycosyltransferase [Chitinophagaceae bacterium]|nr:glycosyltransferase [Chitinophagaceae bacterium]